MSPAALPSPARPDPAAPDGRDVRARLADLIAGPAPLGGWLRAEAGEVAGTTHAPWDCPLARFLAARTGLEAAVDGDEARLHGPAGAGHAPWDAVAAAPLPAWARRFARDVDGLAQPDGLFRPVARAAALRLLEGR